MPWYTYPATEFLATLATGELDVFEFGAGNSTLWWSRRARSVTAAECDAHWHRRIATRVATGNIELILVPEAEFAHRLTACARRFDVIVIDGPCRDACATSALAHIATYGGSVLVLDNADRYPAMTRRITQALGWVRVDMHGFGPINAHTWTTAIWIDQAQAGTLYQRGLQPSLGALPASAKRGRPMGKREFVRDPRRACGHDRSAMRRVEASAAHARPAPCVAGPRVGGWRR